MRHSAGGGSCEATIVAGPSSFGRRVSWLIVGLVALRGLAALCVLPPFEGWDEYQHVVYVERMREGLGRPTPGEAAVPPALLARVVAWPQPHSVISDALGRFGAVGYGEFWARHDPRVPGTVPPAFRPAGTVNLYQAQHGPLYYRLAAPWFALAGGFDDLRTSVAALRVGNVVLTAAAVALVLWVSRRVCTSDRTAFLLALPVACHPLFLINGARVANDALGVLLATGAVGLGVALALGRGWAGRRAGWCALGLGVGVGLASQAKATNLALVPFAGACWLAYAARGRSSGGPSPGRAVWAGLLVAGGFLAAEAGDLAFNFAHHGLPTAMQEAVANRRNGRTTADLLRTAATFRWAREFQLLWARELFYKGGWSFLRTAPRAVVTFQFLVRLGLAGWAVWGLRRLLSRRLAGAAVSDRPAGVGPVFVSPVVPALLAVLVAGYSAGLAYHMVQSKLAWGAVTTGPWYACPALPWFLALVAAGGLAWPAGRFRELVPWGLAATGLAGDLVGTWGWMIPTYATGAGDWPEALRRLAVLQPQALGTATLGLALLAEVMAVALIVLTFRDQAAQARRAAPAYPPPHLPRTLAGTVTGRLAADAVPPGDG